MREPRWQERGQEDGHCWPSRGDRSTEGCPPHQAELVLTDCPCVLRVTVTPCVGWDGVAASPHTPGKGQQQNLKAYR